MRTYKEKRGLVLKLTRELMGIKQKELADMIGVNWVTIHRYEKGDPFDIDAWIVLQRELKLTLDDIKVDYIDQTLDRLWEHKKNN